MEARHLNTIRLIKMLADDLDPAKPNFKLTLDSLVANISGLLVELNLDRPTQDSQARRN